MILASQNPLPAQTPLTSLIQEALVSKEPLASCNAHPPHPKVEPTQYLDPNLLTHHSGSNYPQTQPSSMLERTEKEQDRPKTRNYQRTCPEELKEV